MVLSITDAIVGGEGEGPLANTPKPSGFLSGGLNTAATEWVHARLMGFDPQKIPIVREAFGTFSFPLTRFTPAEIKVSLSGTEIPIVNVFPEAGLSRLHGAGEDIAN